MATSFQRYTHHSPLIQQDRAHQADIKKSKIILCCGAEVCMLVIPGICSSNFCVVCIEVLHNKTFSVCLQTFLAGEQRFLELSKAGMKTMCHTMCHKGYVQFSTEAIKALRSEEEVLAGCHHDPLLKTAISVYHDLKFGTPIGMYVSQSKSTSHGVHAFYGQTWENETISN